MSLAWPGKKLRTDGFTAVVTADTGSHVATVTRGRGNVPSVSLLRSMPKSASSSELKRLIERSSAGRYRATTLLDRNDYQLLLVEAPDVRPEELRSAVRWRIKDLIGFHVDDAAIDVFEIPDQRHANRNRMMYAIAARARRVTERADLVDAAGLSVDVVDIPEMAVRNLAMLMPEEARGLALVHLDDSGGIITISRQGTLYLTRRLDTGVEELNAAQDAARNALCEGVLLEVQRSLDYYESHFPHGPVTAIALTPTAATTPLADYLPQQLETPVLQLKMEDVLAFEEPVEVLDANDILAIGAALRLEARTL
ncbi:MAG: pilus assembly protein PilM [Proteobacteria bacterium]|nr:pilus assembly protein PilM [Pseudomonadota bacterium]